MAFLAVFAPLFWPILWATTTNALSMLLREALESNTNKLDPIPWPKSRVLTPQKVDFVFCAHFYSGMAILAVFLPLLWAILWDTTTNTLSMQPTEVVGTLKNKLDPLPRPKSRVLSKKVVFWLFWTQKWPKIESVYV